MAKILLVEDDKQLCAIIVEWLEHQGHRVECVYDGNDALQLLQTYSYDLIILDWAIPGTSGIDVMTKFRADNGHTHILMLTGKREIADKELGLDSGADDYLTKPFDMKELSARVRALLRRPEALNIQVVSCRHIKLDPNSHKVFKDGQEIKLTPREFQVLEFLMRHPRRVFSTQELLNHIWSSEDDVDTEVVRTSIRRLRKYIDLEGEPSIITNVFGVGYKLDADVV